VKRSEIRRQTPLKRVESSMKAKPLASQSAKTKASQSEHAEIRRQVFERDGRRCQLSVPHPCGFGLTYHHLLKASSGGKYTVENGLTLCAVANDWVEDHPAEATGLGLVRRPGAGSATQ